MEETNKFAKALIQKIAEKNTEKLAKNQTENTEQQKAFIVSLAGDLGAGKTALTKLVANNLGIKEEVISPTYVIQKNYDIKDENFCKTTGFAQLVHIDAYRIEDERELEVIGWDKLVNNPKNLIFVEWPEKAKNLIKPDITVQCQFVDPAVRIYTVVDGFKR